MDNWKKNKKGFSLIELLFVIFLSALAIGISLVSFNNTGAVDKVESATRKIAALIRKAQNNSLAGKQQLKANGTLENTCLNGIEWDESVNDKIAIENFYVVSGGACDVANRSSNVEKEEMEGVELIGAPADSLLYFKVPSGNFSSVGFPTSGNAAAFLKVAAVSDNNIYALVCVYGTGRVEEIFGQVACP